MIRNNWQPCLDRAMAEAGQWFFAIFNNLYRSRTLSAQFICQGRLALFLHISRIGPLSIVACFGGAQCATAASNAIPTTTRTLVDSLGFSSALSETRTTPKGDASVTIILAEPNSARAGTQIVWVELKGAQPEMNIKPVLKFGSSYALFDAAASPDATAVINGGFFGYDAKGAHIPLGLVISDGKLENGKVGWRTGGILYRDFANKLHVTPVRLSSNGPMVAAIQSKPLLVEEGRVAINSDDGEKYNRSAVAITKSGEVLLVGVFNSFGRAMAMKDFARVVAALRSSTGAEVRVAIGMDGGPGAQIYIPGLKLHFGDPGKNFVPNIVIFRNRP